LMCGADDDVRGLYCAESEKQSCADILSPSSINPASPGGAGWMSPTLMLGSSEMVAAAAADGYDGAYAVVTFDKLPLGTCIEVTPSSGSSQFAPSSAVPLAPKLKAQIFNTAASAVDVYMAGGGLGAYNGCSAAGSETAVPPVPFYSKYATSANTDFVSHLQSIGYSNAGSQLDSVVTWQGGIRGGATYAACIASGGSKQACAPPGNGCNGGGGICIEDAETACALAFEGVGSYTTTKAIESCKFAFAYDLHWNRDVRVEVVACPAGLTEVTGLIPANPNSFQGRTFDTYATTMEDCSLPSASRLGNTFDKGPWRPGYDAMYVSNLLGEHYTTEDAPLPTADTPCA